MTDTPTTRWALSEDPGAVQPVEEPPSGRFADSRLRVVFRLTSAAVELGAGEIADALDGYDQGLGTRGAIGATFPVHRIVAGGLALRERGKVLVELVSIAGQNRGAVALTEVLL